MEGQSTEREAIAAFRRGDLDRARALVQPSLARAPSPQILHLMGLIECQAGRPEQGVEFLKRALQADEGNTGYRVMLVRALIDSGRAADALAIASDGARSRPAQPALLHALAEAADAAGDAKVSAESWSAICNLVPGDWRAWASRGNALARLDQWNESAAAFRRAADLRPSEESIRRSLSAALNRAGQKEESLAEIERLLARVPNSAQLRYERAQALDGLGRAAEALQEFDEAARLLIASANGGSGGLIGLARKDDGTDADVVRSMALLFERTNRLDALAELLEQAEQHGIILASSAAALALRQGRARDAKDFLEREKPDSDPLRWHQLMTRIAEALHDPGLAFSEAQAMNREVDDFDEWRAKGGAYRAHIRNLFDTLTSDWFSSVPVLEVESRRSPAFLVGFPRSGTTLLDTFLMGHPDVRVLEEVPMLRAAEKTFGAMTDLPRLSLARLEAARDAYWEELDRHVPGDFSGLVVDKLPMNMLGLPLIHSIFPDAQVIFAQRHPADAVLSGFMQNFILNDTMASFLDIHDAADLYDCAMSVFTRAREMLSANVEKVIYERLVADPEASLLPVIEFLGLEWHEEVLDHQRTARERGPIATPSYDQVTEPLNKAAVGRWRRYRPQLEPVLPILLPWAERLGYDD